MEFKLNLIGGILAVMALGFGMAGSANATPMTYTFSGDINGFSCVLCNGSDNTDLGTAFTFVVSADTTAIDTSGDPFFRINNVNGTFTDGSFSATLTGVTIIATADANFPRINFFNNTFDNGLGLNNPGLNGFSLSTSIGPITVISSDTGDSFLTPTLNGGGFTTTGSDKVFFTGNDSLTFSAVAVTTPVPEPETYALMGLGLGLMGFVARRRSKQADDVVI